VCSSMELESSTILLGAMSQEDGEYSVLSVVPDIFDCPPDCVS
jgi:hypothetical protein